MPGAALALLASYFLGAIPTSYLVSRLFAKIDLREHGSGNLGATNTFRVLGAKVAAHRDTSFRPTGAQSRASTIRSRSFQ